MRDRTGWPTLATYLAWAKDRGCSVQVEDCADAGKIRYRSAVIWNPASGKRVAEIFLEDTDPLMSTTVARLDRRLGLKSHFFI